MNTMPKTQTLSTAEAAKLAEMLPDSFRGMATRARAGGVELQAPRDLWPDSRTPLWDARKLRAYLAQRPGSGRWR